MSKTVPLTEQATRTDGTASHVVIQLADVGGERWLLYRRFNGPKYGGGVDVTRRLALANGVTDFELSGSYGDDAFAERGALVVTYSHRPGGKTILEVNSCYGNVLKKQVQVMKK